MISGIKRFIISLIIFFCAVSGWIPLDLPLKVILFILALDLVTFPLIPSTPFIDASKIVGRVFLVGTLIILNSLAWGKFKADFNVIILLVIALTGVEIILSIVGFGILGIIGKPILIFIIAFFWVFNHNWLLSR
jgi:hypothetical protein